MGQLFGRRNNSVWKRLGWRLGLTAGLGTGCVFAADFTELGQTTSGVGPLLGTGRSALGKGQCKNYSTNTSFFKLSNSYGCEINFLNLRFLSCNDFSLL